MERQIEKGEKDWKKAATSGIAAPACNPRKLKMPAVLKGWVAFQSRQGGTKRGGEEGSSSPLTRGPISAVAAAAAAAPFTETPSKGSLAWRCALQSSPAPEAPRLCRAAKGEVATKANDAVAATTTTALQEGCPSSLSPSRPVGATTEGRGGKAGKLEKGNGRGPCVPASLSRTFTRAATVNEYLPL